MPTPRPSNLTHLSSLAPRATASPQDSFLLVDTLAAEWDARLTHAPPRVVVEVGSGTGYVVTSAALLANDASTACRCFATDVNPDAVAATRATATAHGVGDAVETMRCDLLGPLRESLAGKIDLLLFNPPYVLTPSEEVREEAPRAFAFASLATPPLVSDHARTRTTV